MALLITICFVIPSTMAQTSMDFNFQRFASILESRFGANRVDTVRKWENMIRQVANTPDEFRKLHMVNDFLHDNIRYRTDADLYRKNDYWASPLETIGYGAGDCEDWAIIQYVSLRLAGVSEDKLRLIYVQFRRGGPRSRVTEAHMVLGYYQTPRAVPYILDNLVSVIRPATQRKDLTPVFSFNAEGLWTGQSTRPQASPTARISRWRSVLNRIEQEGFAI